LVLAGPTAAQSTFKNVPRIGHAPPAKGSSKSWTAVTEKNVGIYKYRLTMEVRFVHVSIGGGQYRSEGSVSIIGFQRKLLGLGQWNDVTPSSAKASGSFSGPRSPVLNGPPGSGYQRSNPFTDNNMGGALRLTHFIDRSGPGFEMTHGVYSVTAFTPGGNNSLTASVSW
jgi:hypothetical protein